MSAALLLGTLCALGSLGAGALATTPLTAPRTDWSDGSYQRGYEARFEGQLRTSRIAAETWAALRLAVFGEVAEGAVLGADGWLFTEEEFAAPETTRALCAEVARVAGLLGEHGTALMPVIVPDKARIMAERLPRRRSPAFQGRYNAALARLRAQGLPALDLRPVLDDLPKPFMRTDTHWSLEGARAVAAAVAETVRDLGIALATVDPVHRQGVDAVFTGDLMVFADTGRWRDTVGPAPERIATYTTQIEASGGLFGLDRLEVVLVGTSFSARPDFHFAGFLKAALRADVLNLAQEGRGPFAPMDEALAALAELPTPPRLVIWEIPERYLAPGDLP
ncbi:MAG: hypothetical protein AAGG09_02650 [Pseudomonadota bacterium]